MCFRFYPCLNQYIKTTNDAAPEANMEIWYVDEWMYVISNGTSAKANITFEEMQENYMPEGATGSGALMMIPESWFEDITFEKDGDLYYIEFIVSGEDYLEYMQGMAFGDQIKDLDNISYIVYFDQNGELGNIVTRVDYQVTESGYTFDCHLEGISTISNIGNVTVQGPENPNDFIDVTETMPHS